MGLFNVLLPDHQGQVAIVGFEVSLFVAKTVHLPGSGAIFVGEITKLESLLQEFVPVNVGFAVCVHLGQNTPVLAQHIIDVSDEIGFIAIGPVVEVTAASVAAKALIYASANGFAALQATRPLGIRFFERNSHNVGVGSFCIRRSTQAFSIIFTALIASSVVFSEILGAFPALEPAILRPSSHSIG